MKVCNLIRTVPATRLVQIKLPIKEHRALAKAAKDAGRTLTGHIRLALAEQQPKNTTETQTNLKLFSLFAEVIENIMPSTSSCDVLMVEIRQQLENLSRLT